MLLAVVFEDSADDSLYICARAAVIVEMHARESGYIGEDDVRACRYRSVGSHWFLARDSLCRLC